MNKNYLSSILLLVLLFLGSFGCEKEDEVPPKTCQKLKETEFYDGVESSYTLYQYNLNGLETEKKRYNSNEEITSCIKTSYDSENRIKEVVYDDGCDGEPRWTESYSYEGNTEMRIYTSLTDIEERYYVDGLLIKSTFFGKTGVKLTETGYEYEGDFLVRENYYDYLTEGGNLRAYSTFSRESTTDGGYQVIQHYHVVQYNQTSLVKTWTYTKEDKLIKTASYFDRDYDLISLYTYQYNESGLEIHQKIETRREYKNTNEVDISIFELEIEYECGL